MAFQVGDRVMVLDEDLTGVITKINNKTITVETNDGFLMTFKENELVKNQTDTTLKKELFINASINEVISEKEAAVRKYI
jgi:preprotein translocase subunit YajC